MRRILLCLLLFALVPGLDPADAAPPGPPLRLNFLQPRLTDARHVHYPAADGLIQRATLFTPRHPCGAILLLHGLGASRVHYYPIALELARAGWSVLVPSLRAHGDSAGEYELNQMADDVHAAVDFLQTEVRGPILLLGGSTGGMVGYLAASRDRRIARAVLIAAPLSFQDVVRRDRLYGNLARFRRPFFLLPDPLLNLLLKAAIDSIHRQETGLSMPVLGAPENLPWRETPRMLLSLELHGGGPFPARYGDLRIRRGTEFIRRSLAGPSIRGIPAMTPVLAIVGTGDEVTGTMDEAGIREYRQALPGVRVLVVPADHRKSSYLTPTVKAEVMRFFRQALGPPD